MEDSRLNCLQELPKANPIQKKVPVPPRSILPLLPLPHFRHSDQQQDLAPNFSLKEQQSQHILLHNKISQLFKNPLYQSSSKLSLEASNLNFACLKAFYSESGLQTVPLPQNDRGEEQFEFESRFQSGNLAFATRGQSEREYFLLLQKDTNSIRCTQWFFFRVKNKKFTGKATFRILNFFKNYSSYQNGMKVLVCSESNKYTWIRGCEDISYMKNNLKIGSNKAYYSLSFSYNFQQQNDITYFAHSQPYTYTMLDRYLLKLENNNDFASLFKRRTLTESPGGNNVELITITNFSNKKDKKVVFITSRVHPGQSPSSFVCEGIIDYLLSPNEEVKQLRDEFTFKIVPMLNPDGVINGNYRCSLSGYDLNRVWHYDNKINSPQIFFTKRAILQHGRIFMFIDLHAHSKKKGVFIYGCQNKSSPFISRHIPYLFWKEIEHFNYYQCNFGMKLGREGTSRLNIHRALNLNFSYTMEHSFCGPVKERHHFTVKDYKEIGAGIAKTLRKYYCSRQEPEILKELERNKELLQVGAGEDSESSDDSQLQEPTQFTQIRQVRALKRKQSTGIRTKIVGFSCDSTRRLQQRNNSKHIQKQPIPAFFNQTFLSRNYTKKFKQPLLMQEITAPEFQKSEQILGEQVILTGRLSELEQRTSIDQIRQEPESKSSERYSFNEMDSLNNLFLPSLTSASYKRYAKNKNYPKHFIQVGKAYLETRGLLKQEIRSVSSNKRYDWRTNALSYL